MELRLFELSICLIFSLCSQLLFYMGGHFLLSLVNRGKQKTPVNFFVKMIIGLIVFVTAYAIIKSGFRTYLSTGLILSVVMLTDWKPKINYRNFGQNLKLFDQRHLYLSLLIGVVCFLMVTSQVIALDGTFLDIHPDFSFYASISEILWEKGIETRAIDSALQGEIQYSFYHYFELWLNSILLELTYLGSLTTLMLIVTPTLMTIAGFGTYSLIDKMQIIKPEAMKIILSFLVFFIAPFISTFRWLFRLQSGDNPWNSSAITDLSIKWAVVLIGLLLCFHLYNSSLKRLFPYGLGFLGLMYPPTLILLIPSLTIWYIYLRIKGKVDRFSVFAPILTITFGFLLVLMINHREMVGEEDSLLLLIWQYFSTDWGRILQIIKEPILRIIWMLVTFFPFLILALIIYNSDNFKFSLPKNRPLTVLIAITYILGIFGIPLLEFTKDGDQLFRNLFDPLLALLSFYVLIIALSLPGRLIRAVGWVTLIMIVGFNFSPLFFPKVKVSNELGLISDLIRDCPDEIVYLNDSKAHFNTRRKNIYFIIPYHNIRFTVRGYFPKCLSLDHISLDNLEDRANVAKVVRSGKYYKDQVELKKSVDDIIQEHPEISCILVNSKADEFQFFSSTTSFQANHFQEYSLFSKR